MLRQKKSTKIQLAGLGFAPLKDLSLVPGNRRFLDQIQVTQLHQVSQIAIGIYWRRTYRGMGYQEPWYLLTNLPSLSEAVQAYKKRVGIEAMFKDCKTGGYNLEGSQAQIERLTRLVLLIAIAYTHSTFKGQTIRLRGQSEYLGRNRKVKQTLTRNSYFWLGLYGSSWLLFASLVKEWIDRLIRLNLNKLPFYQRGQRAMFIIQKAF